MSEPEFKGYLRPNVVVLLNYLLRTKCFKSNMFLHLHLLEILARVQNVQPCI